MDSQLSNVPTATNSPAIETEEFKLEMLDCGPSYKIEFPTSLCFSCICGNGCLCGTVESPSGA